MDAKSGTGLTTQFLDDLSVSSADLVQAASRGHRSLGHFPDSFGKKPNPCFPIAFYSDLHEQVEIQGPVLLEIETEIKKRMAKDSLVAKEEGD
jgi:hypothetical protein